MDISTIIISAHTLYKGIQTINVTAGQTLKVETSPAGAEIFNQTVPMGKAWQVTVSISIKETTT